MTKVLVDSNILVYFAQVKCGEKNEISASIVAELAKNGHLCLSVQNLAEFSRVMAEKAPEKIGWDLISEYVDKFSKFSEVLSYSSSTIILANSLAKAHKMHFFDALLAATMRENSIKEIYTENTQDFKGVSGIKAINPFKNKN